MKEPAREGVMNMLQITVERMPDRISQRPERCVMRLSRKA
jgi:hypothetical protein